MWKIVVLMIMLVSIPVAGFCLEVDRRNNFVLIDDGETRLVLNIDQIVSVSTSLDSPTRLQIQTTSPAMKVLEVKFVDKTDIDKLYERITTKK